jgi:sarcosine oxidase subunit beta
VSTVPTAAEIVIVGGGAIGASIAYHLVRRSARGVVVLDRAELGSGSTGRASGGIRQQFPSEIEVRLARESVRFWERFEEQTGGNLDFQKVGYLYLLRSENELAQFEVNVAMQNDLQVPSRMLTPNEVGVIVPDLCLTGVLGGAFCPTDGRAVPQGAVDGFAHAARDAGVVFCERVGVERIDIQGGAIRGVATTHGFLQVSTVINATGPHAADLMAAIGIRLPVFPRRMHQFVTGPLSGMVGTLPCVVEPATSLFVAPEGNGILLGLNRDEPSSHELTVDWDFLPRVVETAARVLPHVLDADIRSAWAGSVELTPDGLPIVEASSSVRGLVLANGFNGHGFMWSPAIGRVVSELILDGAPRDLDLAPFALARFADGA